MKTIFLISVLFIMLAFAFKGPDQSAWDFARQVFSKVSYTLGSEVNNPNNLAAVRRLEQNFDGNIERIKTRLNSLEQGIKKIGNTSNTDPSRKTQPAAPKPKPTPVVKTETATVTPENMPPIKPMVARKPLPRPSVSRGPDLPARPVAQVTSSPLTSSPSSSAALANSSGDDGRTSGSTATLIDSEEIVEIGARFDRASRLLSEIK